MTTVEIKDVSWTERPVTMRLPFQFGSTEVRSTAEAYCTLRIEVAGKSVEGKSAQLMVPRWFDKRQGLSNSDTIEELRATVAAAVKAAPGMRGTALELTRQLRAQVLADMPVGTPELAAGFGPALVEMALIDAICVAVELPFWRAAKADVFGLSAGRPASLTEAEISHSLGMIEAPQSLRLRHTIGFDAPLRTEDVGEDGPKDGLPVSVEEIIARTGINALKIKLKGDPEADLRRLRAIAALTDSVPDCTATLDANEQYSTDAFAELMDGLEHDAALKRLRFGLRFVEQPFPRETALNAPVSGPTPLIIDESDDSEDAFERALSLGWSGSSIKSCKGVLRALLNTALARAKGAVISGEDLTCQPGLCWQQDSAMMSACGVTDVERNGHHFAGGFQGAGSDEIAERMRVHQGIYAMTGDVASLRIEAGRVDVRSLDSVGFGR
ncbi:hypothetical protein IV417_17315 [Alphaproteobacteria bacterium KMM 3653]|uniref:Mandelate racemase/muconate lactonizing enzyme C-terminal domain-containing protein n=1 Tax=Harenicola maris TaxID=2841044 RepID=A0AAP2CT01_9RHOB|nr:hypothetical protein [Harenicola maris]